MTQIHRNKTGTATVTVNGSYTNPRWSVDNPAICNLVPNELTAQIVPVANGSTGIAFRCNGATDDMVVGDTVEVIDPPATELTMTIVENP